MDADINFFSDQHDSGMEYTGYVPRGGYDSVVFRGDVAGGEFIAFWLRDGRVLAGMNVNVWDVTDTIESLVRSGVRPDPGKLADPQVPLRDVAEGANDNQSRGVTITDAAVGGDVS